MSELDSLEPTQTEVAPGIASVGLSARFVCVVEGISV